MPFGIVRLYVLKCNIYQNLTNTYRFSKPGSFNVLDNRNTLCIKFKYGIYQLSHLKCQLYEENQ